MGLEATTLDSSFLNDFSYLKLLGLGDSIPPNFKINTLQ